MKPALTPETQRQDKVSLVHGFIWVASFPPTSPPRISDRGLYSFWAGLPRRLINENHLHQTSWSHLPSAGSPQAPPCCSLLTASHSTNSGSLCEPPEAALPLLPAGATPGGPGTPGLGLSIPSAPAARTAINPDPTPRELLRVACLPAWSAAPAPAGFPHPTHSSAFLASAAALDLPQSPGVLCSCPFQALASRLSHRGLPEGLEGDFLPQLLGAVGAFPCLPHVRLCPQCLTCQPHWHLICFGPTFGAKECIALNG